MQLQWNAEGATGAADPITDYRLRQSASQSGSAASESWWSALVHLADTTVTALETALAADFAGQFIIPVEHRDDVGDPDYILTMYARAPVLDALNASDNTYGVKKLELGVTVSQRIVDSVAATPAEPEYLMDEPFEGDPVDDVAASNITVVPEGTVTMAIIDDGIAFAHNLFRSGLVETRLEGMFIMDAPKPNGAGVGRKFGRRQINRMLARHTTSGLLDEMAFYSDAGSIDMGNRYFSTTLFRRSHGTHVMSLAAGYEMDAAQDKRPIVAVQLPSTVTADTTGANLAPSLITAIRYIKRKASRLRIGAPNGPTAPLVVNFSYGNFAGPHDGTGLIARIIDTELASTPEQEIRVLLPAGNSNLARCNAAIQFDPACAADAVTLDLNVLPDDNSSNYVQMWLPYSADATPPDFVSVRVTPPNGPQSMLVQAQAGSKQVLRNAAGNVIAELSYAFDAAPTSRGYILLAINPTTTHDPTVDIAPSGRWKLEYMKGVIAPEDVIEVRVKRDERLPGYPSGARQSYFDNACYVRFNALGAPLAVDPVGPDECPVKRAGTLSGFACGKLPIVIAGVTQSNGQMAVYSSAGPITVERDNPVPNRTGPDAGARSDDSLVLWGVIAAGSRSGSRVRLSGTSMATPLAARMVAEGLENGAVADRAWVAAQAQSSDPDYPPLDPPQPFVTRTGGGRLNLPYPFGSSPDRVPSD